MSLSVVPLHDKPNDDRAIVLKDLCAPQTCQNGKCGPGSCAILNQIGIKKVYQPGENIFWEDDEAEFYFLVKTGVVRGCRLLSDGRRQISRFIFSGDLIAHSSNGHYAYTAEAVTPVTVVVIPRCRLDQQVGQIECLRNLFTQSILDELQEAQEQVLVLGKMTATERVAHFLLNLAKHTPGGPDRPIEIPMTRSDIADHLGLTIETVSRVIGRLKRDGKIALLSTNRVSVPNPTRLSEPLDCTAA